MIEDENTETMAADDSATFRFVSEDEASRVKVPGYALRREVSRGGQGVVYEAVQESTGQRVALKVVHRTLTDAEHQKQRLDREVRILGTLLHPNIVSILDRGTTNEGLEYFAMRFIDGLPLDRWLATYRESREAVELAQNPGEVLILFRTICEAIQVAHEAGVVHRDLKPSNIRVDRNNLPHVLDFGIARDDASYQASPESPLTLTGQFLGSLPWASPEQAEGKPELINARTDVYALGVILYQALTGEFPYEVVGNMRDVLDNIMRVEPTPPSKMIVAKQAKQAQDARVWRKQHPEVINSKLEDIVLKALAKRQEDRYENAGALAADIARYLAGQKPTAEPHVPAPTRRSKLPIIIILTVLVVVMSILLVVSRPEPEPGPAAGQSAVRKTSRELIPGPNKGDAVAQQSQELEPGPDDFEAPVLDVAQEQADDHITIPAIWQSFRAETTGVLTHISLRPNIYIQGGGTSSGELSVYQGTGTDGSQLFLRTWALESASNAPWQTFDVHVPVEVGQTYTWELTGVSNVYYADTDVYPQGVSSSPPRDLVFRTYVATTPKAQLATPKAQLATPKVQVQPGSGKGASTLPIGTVQAIDGKKAEGEWDAAFQKEVSIALPDKSEGKAMLYVMNDHSNLYVAFEFPMEEGFRTNFSYRIKTKDGKGTAAGRDFGFQNPNSAEFAYYYDGYYDGVSSARDVFKGGTNDGSGRYGWEKGQSFYEFSKPLLTGDANDQAMHYGDSYSLGFSLRLIDPKLSRHGKYPVGFGDTEFPRASHKLIITIATPKAEGGASTAAQAANAARLARRNTSGKGASTLPIGTVQAIDGKKAEGEWDAALQKEVSIVLPDKSEGKAMLYAMNDHDNLYVAFEFPMEEGFSASFSYRIITKDGKGTAAGRDFGVQNSDIVLSSYYDGVGSVQDVNKGGTNDGSGRYGWEKGQSFFEFSKPLLTGDANDQAMHHGDSYFLGITLRLIDPKLSRHGEYPVGFGNTKSSLAAFITIATPKAEGGASTVAQAADAARLARRHTIALRQGGFSPVNFQASSSWKPDNNQFTQNRFDNIIKEPGYSGLEQWYGHLDLGNRQDKQFHFVLDLQKDSRFLMYFDKNNNNDLTDDGVPLSNRGSGKGGLGGFACNISIPWTTLIERSPFPGDFDIWFFNTAGKRISHYSRTQLRGNVLIDGTEYLAMLIDQGPNDADLSNDGIAIDINQNGKIDLDERSAQSHTINGVTHTFNIIW